MFLFSKNALGSPPPMRGKDGGRCVYHGNHGITPAYAGKSYWHGCRNSSRWDHPRLCGEKAWQSVRVQCRQGSPPPMRGKDMNKSKIDSSIRITPAYAGKSETGRFHSLQV